MQVICTDGTILQCDRFEAIDSGVLLFGDERRAEAGEEDDEEAEEEAEAMAFVPLHQLRFVLPEGVQPGGPAQSTSQPTPQPARTGAPPTSGGFQQGQTPPQGMSGQQPPQTKPGGQQSSQYGPGRR